MDGVFSDSSFRSKHFICSWEWFQLNLGLRAAGGPAARPARGMRWQHHQQTTNQVPSSSNWPCWALNRVVIPQIELLLLLQIDLTKQRIELLLPWIDHNEPRIKLLFPGTDLTESRIQLSRTSLSSLESASPPLNRAPLAGAGRRARAGYVFILCLQFFFSWCTGIVRHCIICEIIF